MDEWAWQRCLDVNLKGTFFMSQLVGRVMADENQDRGGLIVNIASTAGIVTPLKCAAAYAASKAGVIGFTRECAQEYAGYGIHVNAVLPETTVSSTQIAHAVLSLCLDDSQAIANDGIHII